MENPHQMEQSDSEDEDLSFNENCRPGVYCETLDSIEDDEDDDEEDGENTALYAPTEHEEEEVEEEQKEKEPNVPHWFGSEHAEQINTILSNYAAMLQVNKLESQHTRAPIPFIGRIRRQQVAGPNLFSTLDKVEVFMRDLVDPGREMPLFQTAHFLTTWESDSGVQLRMSLLDKEKLRFWKSRVIRNVSSFLYRLPCLNSPKMFRVFTANEKHIVSYADCFPSYSPYVPQRGNCSQDLEEFEPFTPKTSE